MLGLKVPGCVADKALSLQDMTEYESSREAKEREDFMALQKELSKGELTAADKADSKAPAATNLTSPDAWASSTAGRLQRVSFSNLPSIRCFWFQFRASVPLQRVRYDAIFLAATRGNVSQLQALLNNGAYIDFMTDRVARDSPLIKASVRGKLDAVKVLVEHKAEIDRSDTFRHTALHLAGNKGHADIAAFLLDSGAEINKRNRKGETALLAAVDHNQPSCVKLLLERKADTTITSRGQSALDIAKEEKFDEIASILQFAATAAPPPAPPAPRVEPAAASMAENADNKVQAVAAAQLSARDAKRSLPRTIVLMGVSGSGKTSVGLALAALWSARLADEAKERGAAEASASVEFADADDFHSEANKAKMRAGSPLNDDDRAPWLAAVREYIEQAHAAGKRVVLACSALKQRYRAVLRGSDQDTAFVLLAGSKELIASRLLHRNGARIDCCFMFHRLLACLLQDIT